MSGFLWLLFQMLVLMLLSAVGGYFLRKWFERSYYKDVTVSYSKAIGEQKAFKQGYDDLNTQYLSLQNKVDSKLDGMLGRFSPIEEKLNSVGQSAKLADVEKGVGAIQAFLSSMPKAKDTDLSPVLGAIEQIRIPEPEKTNLVPVLAAIHDIRIPEANTIDTSPIMEAINRIQFPQPKELDLTPVLEAIERLRIPEPEKTDLAPVLNAIHSIRIPEKAKVDTMPLMAAIRNIKIPEQKAPDFTPVLKAIENIRIPEPQKTNLTPVLESIRKIRIPEVKPTDLTPTLTAIRNIRIPENKPTDVKPVMDAIKQIRIPEAKTTDLSPVLREIKNIRVPEQKQPDLSPILSAIRNINIPRAKEPDLSPLLAEIKALKIELAERKVEKKVIQTIAKNVSSQENKDVIANRLGNRGNRLRGAAFGKPDDLKIIKGVGPKLETMLHGIGVYYYWQVADWSKIDVQEADDLLDAFKGRIDRDDWVTQAGILAKLTTAAKKP